jgi:hypothetical protein
LGLTRWRGPQQNAVQEARTGRQLERKEVMMLGHTSKGITGFQHFFSKMFAAKRDLC